MADHLSVFRLRVAAGDVFDADPLTDSKSVWTITPVVFNDGVDGSWNHANVLWNCHKITSKYSTIISYIVLYINEFMVCFSKNYGRQKPHETVILTLEELFLAYL